MEEKTEKREKKTTLRGVSKSQLSDDFTELHQLIQSLGEEMKPARIRLLNEILKAVVKLAKDNPGTLNLKITATALKELRYSFKMFYPHRHVPKITIFGSARVPEKTPLYDFAKNFAAEAVKRKFMVITGGGPGVMAAGNEGAEKGGFGLNIRLPFEQSANPFIDQENMLINYKYFFTRKLFLVKEAAAFAFFPGGFGTFDEAFEVLTLLQTGKSNLIPVTLLEPKGFGYWEAFCKFVEKEMVGRNFVSKDDDCLYRVFHTPKEALEHIEQFYSVYHSTRYVGDSVVIRLKKKPSEAVLQKLTNKFSKLATDGKFKLSKSLPEEDNEPELEGMTRLVFSSDRKDFAALRRLIDFINENTV